MAKNLLASCLLLGLSAVSARAGALRLRAREHFERASVDFDGASASFFTAATNLNLWIEDPFRRSYGLSFGLGAPKADAAPAGVSEKMLLWKLGGEWKAFFRPGRPGPFWRAGLHLALLNTGGARGIEFGGGPYAGLGWELPVWKIGVSPEFGVQYLRLGGNTGYFAVTPSIGFHFYVFGGDPDLSGMAR